MRSTRADLEGSIVRSETLGVGARNAPRDRACTPSDLEGQDRSVAMGVPKFCKWLSERYPMLNHTCDAGTVPIIDNLYLDMNGVIHNCSHGAGTDVNTRMTEDEVRVIDDPRKRARAARPVERSRPRLFRHGAFASQLAPSFSAFPRRWEVDQNRPPVFDALLSTRATPRALRNHPAQRG